MKKLTVVIILLLTLSAYPLTKNEYYKIIDQAYKTKVYQDAIISIKKAILEYPDEPNFYSNLIFFYIHSKQFNNALELAKKAYPRFPAHQYVVSAYRSALLNSGWQEYNKQNYEKAFEYFSTAYQAFSNDPDTLNGYGSVLRNLKRYEESISVLEKAMRLAPDHQYIRPNLVWTYMNSAWQHIRAEEGEKAKARELLKKAYALGQNMEESFHTSYVYALVNLKLYDEAAPAHALALKKFGLTEEIYQSGFWLLHNPVENYKKQKQYSQVIQSLKALYSYSKQKNLIRENGQSFTDFALMRLGTETASVISKICPYWRKFTPSEKRSAYKLYSELKQNLPSELEFLALRFYGDILYRENRIADAHKFLEKAYHALITGFPSLYRVQNIKIPFPLKGHFLVSNYLSSKHVTHMGLNRHCFDIIGSNENGKPYRGSGASVNDWYGFGVPVYSPVAGKVIHSEDGHQDDPINPPTRGDGNWVAIRSADNKIFNFYHLKKNSIKVRVGDNVESGQQIGELGNSSSTVPHLHFGVYSGDWMVTYPVQFTNYTLYKNNGKTFISSGTPGTHDREEHVYVE